MRVFISKEIPEAGKALLKSQGLELTVWEKEEPISQEELIEQLKQHDAFLNASSSQVNEQLLQECQHLKGIALLSVGYDNVDVPAAIRAGIPVGNTPDVLSDATADIAFLLMLAVSRKAFYMHKQIISGHWLPNRLSTANLGIELKNKTLGVLGLGRIGMEMARRCKGAYNMNILYHNRSTNQQAEEELGATKVSFEELLQRSDVLSVHTALTPKTKGMFNAEAFRKMKQNAIFVNTARGGIHNEEDLLQALEQGTIWGAGLDVTNPEPMLPDNPLLHLENVAVVPHIGSATVEARNAMARIAAENIIYSLNGKRMPHPINPEVYQKQK